MIIWHNVLHVLKVKRAYHTERRQENGNYCICHLNVSKWVGKRFFDSLGVRCLAYARVQLDSFKRGK